MSPSSNGSYNTRDERAKLPSYRKLTLREIKVLEINATQCSVSHCLSLKNSRRYHVNRCQNEQIKKNSIFYSHVYQTILLGDFFSRLHCRVSARLFVVILKGLSASPLDKLFRVSVYFIECSPLIPYGLVCQKVPCSSESISGSLRAQQSPAGWESAGASKHPRLETELCVADACK